MTDKPTINLPELLQRCALADARMGGVRSWFLSISEYPMGEGVDMPHGLVNYDASPYAKTIGVSDNWRLMLPPNTFPDRTVTNDAGDWTMKLYDLPNGWTLRVLPCNEVCHAVELDEGATGYVEVAMLSMTAKIEAQKAEIVALRAKLSALGVHDA
jgi:hypothetical protein